MECGCPDGRRIFDPARHTAFHALVQEQAGVPLGTPVDAATMQKARGLTGGTGATSAGGTDLKRTRKAGGWKGVERGAALRGVRPHAPATSQALSARLSPLRERTVRLDLFALVAAWTPVVGGLTDDDLERLLGRAHQSVSATRNALVADGYLADTGRVRTTRYGNPAVVWAPSPAAVDLAVGYSRRAAIMPEPGRGLPWQ
jgi:hypothetical protein